jgi:hypothetical protein
VEWSVRHLEIELALEGFNSSTKELNEVVETSIDCLRFWVAMVFLQNTETV